MEQVHLLIKNAKVFNSYLKKFISANVAVKDGKFYYIDRKQDTDFQTDNVIDAKGSYMIPGLTDIHMHIESSMTTPAFFGKCAGENGVTTVVSEPHEMANVKGIRGILEMISAAKNAPIDIFYGIPSSVPSTSEKLETTGGIIDCGAMKHLLEEKDVVCVGEIMNYRQIIRENDLEISRFLEYLKKEHPGYVIEGHCPSLLDLDLAKFLYLGINGDHTEHTLEEVKQRIENGMFFEIQDKMLKPEILEYICQNQLYEYCSFVTDDTMADALYEQGPLNAVVQKAIDMGFPMEQAIYCATYTPCHRMHFYDRGAIAPGKLADFMLLKDPSVLKPEAVFKNGVSIYVKGEPQLPLSASSYEFPADFYRSVQLPEIFLKDFQVNVPFQEGYATVRVMEVNPDRTHTTEKLVEMPVKDGKICWENSGCLLAMVVERHGKNGNIGYGFLTGSCLKKGTVATTYFHDHHNLFVEGSSPDDMLFAVNRIRELQGGFLTVKDGRILSELALPVCGLLSEKSIRENGLALKAVRKSLTDLGYVHNNPIMSVGTLGLPVSPALKLTDKGLVDVKKGEIVPLIVSTKKNK